MNKSKFKARFPLILAVIIFGSASIDAFIFQDFWWGVLNLFVVIANIGALKYSENYPELSAVFLGILNAAIAFLTAWICIDEGKQYIQFVWIAVGVVYLASSYIFLNKAQKKYL